MSLGVFLKNGISFIYSSVSFFGHTLKNSVWNLSSLIKDQTCAFCIGRAESKQLDCQGSPRQTKFLKGPCCPVWQGTWIVGRIERTGDMQEEGYIANKNQSSRYWVSTKCSILSLCWHLNLTATLWGRCVFSNLQMKELRPSNLQ